MIVAAEIVVGHQAADGIDEAADVLAEACRSRGYTVHRLAEPTGIDNRLCLYLAAGGAGYPIEDLLDVGVRRIAYARLDRTQYLIRSWRGGARLHVALAARSSDALKTAARALAERIAGGHSVSALDLQGPE